MKLDVRSIAFVAVVTCLGAGAWGLCDGEVEHSAWAQKPKGRAGGTTTKSKDGGVSATREAGAAPTEATTPAATRVGGDSGVVEAKTVDGGRVFKFGELEVEGRLRSPQIVYFLRRVRAEFAAGELGHRSFMGELSQTRNATAF